MCVMVYTFNSDKLNIRTRNSDNSLIVTLETGEQERNNVKQLFDILGDNYYKVTLEVIDG